ncbi:mediator of RNA polymerase II transcription subunit 14-like isoform X2 [Haliotis rubra]|uniref:mediator of RNA polymerase II transcription subunit 14-like isoform X2 n=1 Tax=Haliotis rubra TaxID=36100 RepID=UPI001EE6018A|nr:mediator of RNA polymerase II transcription subunit 14-like isoform X2 [Haliotis rubra]
MPQTEMAVAQGNPGGAGTISLATLIDYSLQRTHHELSILSELLPRKTDMDRKIEIFQFANRTRQLFVRLLALVKWATSASKVDKCTDICNFLEQQSFFFVDTADQLAKVARETLVTARLPSFSLPCAIDVLTTGTYPRLPTCIRDKIVPPDPITPQEKKQTLDRLNQVIQYRLVSSELPPQMRRLKIENGRVKFLVEHEFEVTLTLMGDSPTIPWRLLDIDILVEDHETGDGKSLVHSLQIHYIHQLAQNRLLDNDKPLHDLYKVLHSFCQSLQLEVLHSQTQRLIRNRLGDSVRVEEYTLSKSLQISYWRDQLKKDKDGTVFKLSVHVCDDDDGKPLQISHSPPMSPDDSNKVGLAIKSDQLSIEKLLMQTIEVRTHIKLKEFAKEMQRYVDEKCEVRDMPVALHVPLLTPSMSSEILRISIDIQRGSYLTSVPCLTDHSVVKEIEDCLNADRRGLEKYFTKLRMQLCLQRCEKSVQLLPAQTFSSLPIVNIHGHPVERLGRYKLFIKVPKQSNFFVVVELVEKKPRSVEYKNYVLETTPCTADGTEDDLAEDVGVKLYLNAGKFIEVDNYSTTHGPFTKIFEDYPTTQLDSLTRKRKLFLGGADLDEPDTKKVKGSPYFVPELAYLLVSCEERIPFVYLGDELNRQDVPHQGIQVDEEGICLVLGILDFPECGGCSKEISDALKKQLLSCKFRILSKPLHWVVEFLFTSSPLDTSSYKESGNLQRVTLNLDLSGDNVQKTVTDLKDEWSAMGHLYSAVQEFVELYNDPRTGLQLQCDVRSYNYRRLTLAYGPTRSSIVTVQWRSDGNFHIMLGTSGQASTGNPHIVMATQLQADLNTSKSLAELVTVLNETWSPMTSISKLSTATVMGVTVNNKQPVSTFTILPQSSTHVRIAFRGVYCLDVHFKSGNIVAVRDGAYSLFDTSKAVEGFNPAQGLKAFLNLFYDESVIGSHARRRSTTDDDNPPSPIGMDTMDIGLYQNPSVGSPAVRQRQDGAGGFRFQNPMTPPSNPHTPASPGVSRIPAGVNPSPSTLMGNPSPGTLLTGGSPGNPHLHVPSPSSFVPAPSPQSLGIHMQSPAGSFISPSMVEGGSPYPSSSLAMPSPNPRNWPGSPSVQGPSPASHHMVASPGHPALHSPQTQHKDSDHSKASVVSPPSRMLPQRSWAASVPTLLSHEAFSNLLTPNTMPTSSVAIAGMQPLPASPIERFFGCVYMRRHLSRQIQSDDSLTALPFNEPGVNVFKGESLQYKVSMNQANLQTLQMKAFPTQDCKDPWAPEELQILEKFFELKVAGPPYKINALTAFSRLLGAPTLILKDCIQIMRMELMPDRNLKWSVQWCLTIPPGTGHIINAPAGTPAIVINLVKGKMVLMLQLTRLNLSLPIGKEPPSLIIPLFYDIGSNTVTHLDIRNTTGQQQQVMPNTPHSQTISAVNMMLKRYMDMNPNSAHCVIFPALQELMVNLVLPVQNLPHVGH